MNRSTGVSDGHVTMYIVTILSIVFCLYCISCTSAHLATDLSWDKVGFFEVHFIICLPFQLIIHLENLITMTLNSNDCASLQYPDISLEATVTTGDSKKKCFLTLYKCIVS